MLEINEHSFIKIQSLDSYQIILLCYCYIYADENEDIFMKFKRYNYKKKNDQEILEHSHNFMQLMLSRRSIRDFSSKVIPDKVIENIPGERAVAIKNVTFNEPQFQGHFPERPLMPGVLIVESMAQVGGIIVTQMPEIGRAHV